MSIINQLECSSNTNAGQLQPLAVTCKALTPPGVVRAALPLSNQAQQLISTTRQQINEIIHGRDQRLLVVVGPCSIHDPQAALDYAQGLLKLRERYQQQLLIVMRVYFEKPRTTVGWKGLINDPHLNDSYDIDFGIKLARQILVNINELGMPCAGEFLDTMSGYYLADCISWGAIGARTTESPLHRELASALALPIGFKNATCGSVKPAIDAMIASAISHSFISIDDAGQATIASSAGNHNTHIILRGGNLGPNYYYKDVEAACNRLEIAGFYPGLMIDCSHGNSSKDYNRQLLVVEDIASQLQSQSSRITGVMLESHLVAGRQDLCPGHAEQLIYGQSITDACIDLQQTEQALALLAQVVANSRQQQQG